MVIFRLPVIPATVQVVPPCSLLLVEHTLGRTIMSRAKIEALPIALLVVVIDLQELKVLPILTGIDLWRWMTQDAIHRL